MQPEGAILLLHDLRSSFTASASLGVVDEEEAAAGGGGEEEVASMAFTLYTLIQTAILCTNAIAVLHEERFLSKSKYTAMFYTTYNPHFIEITVNSMLKAASWECNVYTISWLLLSAVLGRKL